MLQKLDYDYVSWVSYLSDFGVRNFEIQVAPSVDGSGNLVDAVTCTIYEAYVNQGAPTTFECDMPRSGRYVAVRARDANSRLSICNIDVHGTIIGEAVNVHCVVIGCTCTGTCKPDAHFSSQCRKQAACRTPSARRQATTTWCVSWLPTQLECASVGMATTSSRPPPSALTVSRLLKPRIF